MLSLWSDLWLVWVADLSLVYFMQLLADCHSAVSNKFENVAEIK